jgi:CheY-like chemotaxis protein/HPt (histidine-containing phosphotransfer) domain-containing protein
MIRVLHVDDDPDIREVVKISLDLDRAFLTRSCSSGREALEVAEQWPPDVILLDVMMPIMDGPATLARLRGDARTATIPVVFMTARAQTREIDLFRSYGAAGVIRKPFDPVTLGASLRSVLPAEDLLDSTRSAFLRRVKDDAAMLAKHRSTLRDQGASPAALAEMRQVAHGLAGAAGIFGFSEISDAAAALEEAVIVELDGSGAVGGMPCSLDRLLACIETNTSRRKEQSHSTLDA